MDVTATEAKNRFGQVLEQAQRGPVFIEKGGRRHSVVVSAEHYDRLLAAANARSVAPVNPATLNPEARAFYERYKDWVDEQNRLHEQHGVWNDEFRRW